MSVSVSMVSHSPYLCPDYLGSMPPNTPMDNTKSPLALLAQTCNSIGMPDPPNRGKTILPASEKSLSPGSGGVKKEPVETKSATKSENSTTSEEKTPKKDSSSVKNERASSTGGATDENGNCRSKENGTVDSTQKPDSRPTSAPTESRNPITGVGTSTTQAVPPTVPSLPSTSRGFPTTLPAGCPSIAGFPFGLPSSSMYPHGLSLPGVPSVYSGIPSLGGGGLPRYCMDPTCKSCPAQSLGAGRGCPLGCTQCASHSMANLTAMSWLANSYNSFLPGFPAAAPPGVSLPSVLPGIGSTNGINAPLPGSFPSLSGSSGIGQHICNWVTDTALGKICLKCFTTGEELLQHTKTHTLQDSSGKSDPLLSLASPPLGTPAPGHATGRLSPRTAANYWNALRYHPYYSKLTLTPTAAAGFGGSLNQNPHLLFPPTLNPAAAGYSAALTSLYAGQRLPGSFPPHP